MSTIPMRRPWQGVLQILRFNWRFYAVTAGCVALALLALPFLPLWQRAGVLIGAAPALFWLASSLLVSHYVYDRFPLYDLHWIARALSRPPRRWINIHCGLDETSGLLTAIFPDACGKVVDIFDGRVMTETSIRQVSRHGSRQAQRARNGAIPAMQARFDNLVFSANSFDAAFCIFAAHELRCHDQRVRLFKEIARVLVPEGELVLMEHLRDWRNLLAFGPGFLHFFSQRAWRKATQDAGLALRAEFSMTPFVRVYILRRAE
jgi:SAM-dependent methyltransferase